MKKEPKMEKCQIVTMYRLSPPWGPVEKIKVLKVRVLKRGKKMFVPQRKRMWSYGELFESKKAALDSLVKERRQYVANVVEELADGQKSLKMARGLKLALIRA